MKKNLAILLLTCLFVCCTFGLIACNKNVHTHTIEKVEAKAATCETAGNIEYYRCTDCDKLFSDESYTETTLDETVVAALGHDLEHHDAQAPSCTQDGWDAYDTCKRDGCEYTTYEKIDALGHDEETHDGKPATCTEDGYEAYKTCKRNGCDYTTYQKIDALDHDMQPVAKKDATCTEAGYAAYEQCSRCNHNTKGNDIPAIGHANKVHHEKVDATCTETGTIEYWSCSVCNKNYSDEECTKAVTDLIINALGHDYAESTFAGTETEDGYKYYVCGGCNDDYKVYTYNGIDDKVAVSTDMTKQVASNRVDGKGTLTYRVQAASAHRVKLYVNVSSTGSIFNSGLALTTVISSVRLNGTQVSGYSGFVPTGADEYADYLIGEIDLVAGKNLIEITVGEYSWAGPFFRSISIETAESVTLVEPFDGYVVKATANEVFVVGAYKDTANDRIYPNTGANAMGVTVGVKATKTAAVDLYATVSGHGFDETVLLTRVISALSVNGEAVTVEATALPKATDVYNNYKVATITLNEGENVISLTSEHLAYFGPFFRGLMIKSLDKVEFYNAVPTFSGADSKVAVTEGMVKQPEADRVCGEGTMTYKVNASKAGTAKLYVTISSMGTVFGAATNVNEVITAITVNGNAVTGYSETIPAGADLYSGLYIAEITLQEGENVITVTDGKYSWAGPYFRSISLIGDATFSLLDANA